MKIIRLTDRSGKRRSAHGEPVEPWERSVALELLERLEPLLPRVERLEQSEAVERFERLEQPLPNGPLAVSEHHSASLVAHVALDL